MKKVKCLLSVLLVITMAFLLTPVYAASPEGNTEHTITDNISAPPDTKINMFDYWTVGKQNDFDNGVQIEDMHEVVGGGINQNHLLLFGNGDGAYSGIGENDWCKSTVGEWNCYTGPTPENTVFIDGPGHPYRGIVSEELGEDGYPKLDLGKEHIIGTHDVAIPEVYFDKTARIKTNESLAYLFDPSEKNQPGKAVYENVTGLFRKNDNGYYYFNSDNDNNGNNCFAELNTENGENKFVLYETPWLYNDKPQFFPFSNHTDLVNEQDCDVTGEKVNHYFGMTMEYEFTQPKGGIVKTDTLGDKDMTFEISGDDDIWVFIDNKLAIDMGGIHEKCRAEINFKTGVIDYYNDAGVKFRTVYLSYAMGERSGELDSGKWKTLQDSTNGNNFSVGTFADNTIHTMKVFYLERGNNDSDFGIKFNTYKTETTPSGDTISIDFTKMTAVPVYSTSNKQGFVSKSDAIMPEEYRRQVADTSKITIGEDGASVTESDGSYLYNESTEDYNYGGLIYRQDVAPGAYHLEVEVADASNTTVAPNGMQASRLVGTSNWDNCLHVPRTVSAKWDGNVWTYDFATGEDFVEIEIEPNKLPTKDAAQTVGVKSIKITPLAVNPAGDKPTIHILGDSTQKAYSFNETISSWGQMLGEYFDPAKVTVINYSMGGRAMKSNYNEGRTMEPLITGKAGDFVFIHSAHNDETLSNNRFSRGSGIKNGTLTQNNASYQRWLDMYIKMIKARGMTPVLVTAMPRTGNGSYSEDPKTKPNGFNPDSPGLMREKAKSDPEVGLVELYDGATNYIDQFKDKKEIFYIYNTYEAGETPAENSANGTKGDGTHYRESAARQWCRIMLQSMYDQSVAGTDTYTDKNIMAQLVSYMPDSVQNAAKTKDWSDVFPEMASDVSTIGIKAGATQQSSDNFYYRPNIEKALQIGALHKDKDNNFKPTAEITVGEFARGIEKVFGLSENSLSNYSQTYAELTASGAKQIGTTSFEATSDIASVDGNVEVADAAGDLTVTVTQPTEGGKITVYNESQRVVAYGNVPVAAQIKADTAMVDNDYFTLTAPHNLAQNSKVPGNDSKVSFESGKITGDYVYYRNKEDAEVKYTAKASGQLVVYASLNADTGRKIFLVNEADSNDSQAQDSGGASGAGSVTFNVEKGKTYKLYQSSSDQKLYGVVYQGEYPQSDTSLKANSGDTIRVTASAEDGYTLNSILVGGEAKSNKREYTFEITANTTVSAKFDKEPELVEHTMIASDAALTREAMGAILYDAYTKANAANGKWITNAKVYMNQKGGALSPDDPNYDPNITYNGGTYLLLTGWGALTDTDSINTALYAKVKQAYNLGLMRTEEGIVRGDMKNGTKLQPTTEVTRAKAAKALVFCYILGQLPTDENHLIYIENQSDKTVADIAAPNSAAPTTVFGE